MYNKVILIGSCGNDPEIRFFPSGDKVATISLATSRRWKDKQTNEKKEKTQWHNLVFNRGLADVVEQYVTKGSKLSVEGEIDYQQWEKDGVKHYATRILVSNMVMLDSKKDGDSEPRAASRPSTGQSRTTAQPPAQPTNGVPYADDFNDDIPF